MNLNFSQTGTLGGVRKVLSDYFDAQVFLYPEYAVQIAGVRAGFIGQCAGLNDGSNASVNGHLICDGSLVESDLNIMVGVS